MKNVICRRVIDVTEEGITLESDAEKVYIDFKDCVKNFSSEEGKNCNCVLPQATTFSIPPVQT